MRSRQPGELPCLRLERKDVGTTELTGAIFLGAGALVGLPLLTTLSDF